MGGCTEALTLPLVVIGRTSAAVLDRANGLLVGRSGRRNSRCMRSTMGVKASLAIFRSVRPNFVPRSSQFASRRDLGVMRWIITPTKASQPGAAWTASVIVNSSSSAVFETRVSLLHHFLAGDVAGACTIVGGAAARVCSIVGGAAARVCSIFGGTAASVCSIFGGEAAGVCSIFGDEAAGVCSIFGGEAAGVCSIFG